MAATWPPSCRHPAWVTLAWHVMLSDAAPEHATRRDRRGQDGPRRLARRSGWRGLLVADVHHDRGVVGWFLALAGITVHEGARGPLGQVLAHQDEIDPHAAALVEIAGPIVPPGEHPGVIEAGEDVVETPGLDVSQGGPFRLTHVGHTLEVGRVPHV